MLRDNQGENTYCLIHSCSRSYLQLPQVNAPVAYLGWRGDGRRSAGLRYCRSVAAHRPSSVSSPWRRLASAPLGRTPVDALALRARSSGVFAPSEAGRRDVLRDGRPATCPAVHARSAMARPGTSRAVRPSRIEGDQAAAALSSVSTPPGQSAGFHHLAKRGVIMSGTDPGRR